MFKKVLATVTAALLLASTASFSMATANGTDNNLPKDNLSYTYAKGGFDAGIANEDKVINMLVKSGKIPANATYEQKRSAYLAFVQKSATASLKYEPSKKQRTLDATNNAKVKQYRFKPAASPSTLRSVNVLVLLAEYSDYEHNKIDPVRDGTDNFYADFNAQHYQDLLFGTNGIVSPSNPNQRFLSMKQFYNLQSGGDLDVTGQVFGWYKLPGTAASYGAPTADGENDCNPRQAVKDALAAAASSGQINFADFDQRDIYDYDKDGNYNEPDGVIDYLMVIHAGMGEDEGGGMLLENAIWSHRWNLENDYTIPGTNYKAYDYTIEPENGATGVCAHEFGHNLGLPDEYDTQYTSDSGEPISYWSIMSGGSWGGAIQGTEPTGFSPYAKEYFQGVYGGNWQQSLNLDINALPAAGALVNLKQADEGGQVVRVTLPDKPHVITTPVSGQYAFWGGKGSDGVRLLNSLTARNINIAASRMKLNFKTWYDIEDGWDYASVQVAEAGTNKWVCLSNSMTTTQINPDSGLAITSGITGTSRGWVDASFDLSAFTGKKVDIKFEYATDDYVFGNGMFIDDIQIMSGKTAVYADNADGTQLFGLEGFVKNNGTLLTNHYYLVEWRNHHGSDMGLKHIASADGKTVAFDPGMVVWYVDNYYGDNWTGLHPGGGFLSVVDADQTNFIWNWTDRRNKPFVASARYQMHDAAFSKNIDSDINVTVTIPGEGTRFIKETNRVADPIFSDMNNYTNPQIPTLGVNLPKTGLSIQVTNQAADNSTGTVVFKKN